MCVYFRVHLCPARAPATAVRVNCHEERAAAFSLLLRSGCEWINERKHNYHNHFYPFAARERERENNKEIVFYCIAPPVAGAPDPEMNEFFVLLFYSCPVDSLVLINRVLEMRAKRSKKKK